MEQIDVKKLLEDNDPNIRLNACRYILAQNLTQFAHEINLVSKNDDDWFVRIMAGYVLYNFNPIAKKLFRNIVKSFFRSLEKNQEYKLQLKDELYDIFSNFDYTISQIDTIFHLAQLSLTDYPKNIPKIVMDKLGQLKNSKTSEKSTSSETTFISAPTSNFDIDSLMELFESTDIKQRKLRDSFFTYKNTKASNPYLYPKGALNYLDHVNDQIKAKNISEKFQTREFNRVVFSNQLLLYFSHFESYMKDIQYIIFKTKPRKFQAKLLRRIDDNIMLNSCSATEFLTNLVQKYLDEKPLSLVDRMEFFEGKLKIDFGILEHDKDFFLDAYLVRKIIVDNRSIVNRIHRNSLKILNLQIGEIIHLDQGFIEKIAFLVEDLSAYLCLRVIQKYLKLKI